jgi:recombination associated protein RdgC
MFRNLRLYRVSSPWPETEEQLSALLEKCSFVPCGPLTEKRSGWEKPVEHENAAYSRRVSGADLLQMRTQSRLLPAAAIQEALVDRVDEFRSRMGEEPSRRALRRLKEETRDELLPKALLRSERINGFFLTKEKLLGIDAASDSKAERFLDLLRASLQNLEFTPLSYAQSPGDFLTALFLGDHFKKFALGNECRMQDLSEQKSVATWRHTTLSDPAIRQHIIDGMKLSHLQIEFDDLMGFVMADNGAISKIRFPEADAADINDEEDPVALLDARFVLLTGTVRALVSDLKELLGGYASETATHADAA